MDASENDNQDGRPGTGFQVDLVKSYLAFGRRAVAAHWKLAGVLLIGGLVLTGLANAYVPKTFECTTVLMALGNPVLEGGNSNTYPLAGASGLIMRHDNLESIVRDIGLVAKSDERRPPLLKLKDRLSGAQPEAVKAGMLVGTLENRIQVSSEGQTLTIYADWTDGQTAADLAASALESFLKARHSVEVSAFEEKVGILDQHASKLREEIEGLAQQINSQSERATAVPTATTASALTAPARSTIEVRVPRAGRAAAELDAELPSLKEKLDTDKKKLADFQAEYDRKVREEQAKLEDLKLRLTPAHPLVVTQAERVAMVSQVPPEMNVLRAEVTDLTGTIRARVALAARAPAEVGGTRVVNAAPIAADPLPTSVVQALQNRDSDQALAQQLTGAVVRYGLLRDDIGSSRVAWDTAQAAFNHRYQTIIPVEVPSKPKKPKAIVILGGGLAASLLLALLFPIVAEIRKGVLVERWQVEQLQLPVLAELHLPSQSE